MGALLAGIGLAQFIGLAISAAGVVVPEIDQVAARRLEKPKCSVTYVIITKPVNVKALRRILAARTESAIIHPKEDRK
jgi:hypothetical protein